MLEHLNEFLVENCENNFTIKLKIKKRKTISRKD